MVGSASPRSDDPTTADLVQAHLESLDDEAWATFARRAGLEREQDGPLVTGDEELDALEREAWEEEYARRARAAAGGEP